MPEWISFSYCTFGLLNFFHFLSHPVWILPILQVSVHISLILEVLPDCSFQFVWSFHFTFSFRLISPTSHFIWFFLDVNSVEIRGGQIVIIFLSPQELGQRCVWATGTRKCLLPGLWSGDHAGQGSEVKKLNEGYPLNAKLFGDYHVNADLPNMLR